MIGVILFYLTTVSAKHGSTLAELEVICNTHSGAHPIEVESFEKAFYLNEARQRVIIEPYSSRRAYGIPQEHLYIGQINGTSVQDGVLYCQFDKGFIRLDKITQVWEYHGSSYPAGNHILLFDAGVHKTPSWTEKRKPSQLWILLSQIPPITLLCMMIGCIISLVCFLRRQQPLVTDQ
jgi:hypothetical protein